MRTVFLLVALSVVPVAQSLATEKIYEVGKDGVTAPKPIRTPEPDFPEQARRDNKAPFRRVVALDGYVGKDGRFHDAKVVNSAGAEFDKEALRVIKRWKFHPAMLDGKPVNCRLTVEMQWNLLKSH